MARIGLTELDGRDFDVVVIGAGATGASAAQHLAAAGYGVLVVDKADFASGASSRSGRLLHCGLRFLEPGEGLGYRSPSIWDSLRHPREFARNLRRARDAMGCRAQFVATMPERVSAFTFCLPLWREGPYRPWQAALGLRLLGALGPREPPLEALRLTPGEIAQNPLFRALRDPERLAAAFTFREYRFEWPERIVLDTLLDARRMGALARNYTPALAIERDRADGWRVTLGDAFETGARASVTARLVLNNAGAWTDRVSRLASEGAARRIQGTKGTHIMVRLPPGCAAYGILSHNSRREPYYLIPWRGLHYVGPTDTPYEGDIDDVRATEDEIEGLIAETNGLLPGLGLERADVLFSWAGVRPLTYDPEKSMGVRGYVFHDLGRDGLDGMFAMTSSPLLSHRLAGRRLAREVARRLSPSGRPKELSYAAKPFHEAGASPALLNHWPEAKLAHLSHTAAEEDPVTLADLLFRRVGAGWTETMGREGARLAAETVSDAMG
ncbi:MAG: FAD-dependent oxidoreductase, partial [Alphaproteobacteria bacterium]